MAPWRAVLRHPVLFFRTAWRASVRKRQGLPMACLAAGAAATMGACSSSMSAPPPPETKIENVTETLHGVEITDPYRWLEDQDSPETRAWIAEQTKYYETVLGQYKGKDAIVKRLTELEKTDRVTSPFARNGRYFYRRRSADQEQYKIVMRQGPAGEEKVLVDPASVSEDVNSSAVIVDVSLDGSLLAYGVREGGQDEVAVRILQVDTGEHLTDQLPKRRYGSVNITPDKKGVYYSLNGDENPRLYEHTLGQDDSADKELFGKGYGAEHLIYGGLSDDGRWLYVIVYYGSSAPQTDVFVKDLKANGPLRPMFRGIPARFLPQPAGDRFIVLTNHSAPNSRVISVDPLHPEPANWRELIPEDKAPIENMTLAGGKIYALYLEDVKSRLRVFNGEGKAERDIALPAIGAVSELFGEWDSPEMFYTFESFHYPPETHRVDSGSGQDAVWARVSAPVKPEDYELKQVFYQSKDGTRVPMFLLHRAGLEPSGDLPVLMFGYGGFLISETPAFSPLAVTWADNGGVYALPNLRGGAEYGEAWHEAGMLEKKQNVFDDFIAASEWLIDNNYTNPDRLAIRGRSNGGLLVGAAFTQRPELYKAVICGVPLLDMLRYDKFLVARFWVPEYGSADDPEQFKFLRAYSPYQNVKPNADYPAIMFFSGDGDTRVAPLHARKMTALMQASGSSGEPIILRYDTEFGHSAGVSATKQIEDEASELLFLFGQLGINQ